MNREFVLAFKAIWDAFNNKGIKLYCDAPELNDPEILNRLEITTNNLEERSQLFDKDLCCGIHFAAACSKNTLIEMYPHAPEKYSYFEVEKDISIRTIGPRP